MVSGKLFLEVYGLFARMYRRKNWDTGRVLEKLVTVELRRPT